MLRQKRRRCSLQMYMHMTELPKLADGPTVVAIIDDDSSYREALVRLLAAAGLRVRAYSSARTFLDSPDWENTSCVVSDLRMPSVSGLQLQATMHERTPNLSIIFISGYAEVPDCVTAMKAGAVDFLEKPVKAAELMEAIRSGIARTVRLNTKWTVTTELRGRFETLTNRERDVFTLVAAGLLNKQVAAELHLAEKTVKQHRGRVMRKMAAESLADLAVMAHQLGVRPSGANFSRAKGRITSL
jgi:FixJ family two-component response regulator